MSKSIVINAGKDRSRIAIVEDGELVELFIENPEHIRTIGNIYLGTIRKLMPAIKAAFVDIGQKQDAFLHFSDLTDNLPELLRLVGEPIPERKRPQLQRAPKVMGDSELEVEEETEDDDEKPSAETPSSRSRSSRGRRRGGATRRGGRSKPPAEEDEQEDVGPPPPTRRSSFVIDLTAKPGRISTEPARPSRPAPEPPPPAAPEALAPDEVEAEEEMPAVLAAETPADALAAPVADAPTAEVEETPAPRARSRRGSRKTTPPDTEPASASTEDDASIPVTEMTPGDEADTSANPADATDAPEEAARPRRGSRRGSRRSTLADGRETSEVEPVAASEEATPEAATDLETPDADVHLVSDEQDDAEATDETTDEPTEEAPAQRRGRRRGSRRGRRGSGASAADETATTDAEAVSTDAPSADATLDVAPKAKTQAPAEPKTDAQPRSREGSPREGGSREGNRESSPREGGSRDGGRNRGARDNATGRDSGPGRERSTGNGARPAVRPAADNEPQIPVENYLRKDQQILVKIIKEPISTKGSRISTDISLAGRFLVLVPLADYVAVSKKIESSKERRRLRALADSLRPEGFGVIVRTVAEGRDAKTLDTDLRLLLDKWRKIEKKLKDRVPSPQVLYEDVNMVSSIIRDLFTDDYDRILVDDPKVYRNIKTYVQAVAPHMANMVQMHKGPQGVFRSVGIEGAVEAAFSPRVNMASGGYLFIEHTEAMHVVDVNSGRAGRGLSQSENLLAVNLEAAREIAKQLRLRDLGGIIVVDFIDMRLESHRRKVYDELKKAFRKDRAVTKLLPMSDFGLVEITRQRLRPSITTDEDGAAVAAEIPVADPIIPRDDFEAPMATAPSSAAYAPSTGYLQRPNADQVADDLEDWLKAYRDNVGERYRTRPVEIHVHSLLAHFLSRGLFSRFLRWKLTMRQPPFQLVVNDTIDPTTFDVRDRKSGKSLTKQYSTD